jgi:16S rRNA C967 or C1407 C5-methylase (RsmB/RsmF family)
MAFDKDAHRLERLQANIVKTGASGVITASLTDFLSIDPLDPEYAQASAALCFAVPRRAVPCRAVFFRAMP